MSHPVIPSDFVYCESRTDLPGSAFVLSLKEPYLIGTVLTFTSDLSYLQALGKQSIFFSVIPGYRIIIKIIGSITDGKHIEISPDTANEIHELAEFMGQFFIKERIAKHKNYYNRFKM
jgi:hypothetical protein